MDNILPQARRKRHALVATCLLLIPTTVVACGVDGEPAVARAAEAVLDSVPEAQSEPNWSHDGTRIAFRGGSFPEVDIWVAGADGGAAARLTDHPAAESYPVWSPDDDAIAFVSNRDGVWKLYVMNPDGSGVRGLAQTSVHAGDPARPAWTPDGEELIIRIREEDESTRLAAVPVAGGEPWTIAAPEGADWPDVAPDGSIAVSAAGEDGVRQIWMLGSARGAARPITAGPGRKSLPRFTADGRQLVYVVKESGAMLGWDLARISRDGSGTRLLTDDDHWKFYPEPSPDGTSILFTTIRGGMSDPPQLWLVDADGANPRPLFKPSEPRNTP